MTSQCAGEVVHAVDGGEVNGCEAEASKKME